MELQEALTNFLTHITEAKEADRLKRFPSLLKTVYTTEVGQKNIRIVEQDENGNRKSVFCFIRKADGAELKAAGWRQAPAKLASGTIYTIDPTEYGVGVYGANYMR